MEPEFRLSKAVLTSETVFCRLGPNFRYQPLKNKVGNYSDFLVQNGAEIVQTD